MANPGNIEGQGFHTHPERINRAGRAKGSKNRSTIVRELLDALHSSGRPNVEVMTVEIINKALAGDVNAWEKLLDSGYGKLTENVNNTHTFNRMNDVVVGKDALEFDVGEPPCAIEGDAGGEE